MRMKVLTCMFFFSSRRRHTRLTCDWSSDVCSSDLRVKRRRKPRPKRASKLAARRLPVNGTAVAASAVAPSRGLSRDSPGGDAEPLADSGLRPLLERYCRLAGVKRAALGPDHAELSVPPGERPFFRDRASLRVAFSLDALERDPDAEIAVLGSPFLAQLIEAIRARGARRSLGLIAPALSTPGDPRDEIGRAHV